MPPEAGNFGADAIADGSSGKRIPPPSVFATWALFGGSADLVADRLTRAVKRPTDSERARPLSDRPTGPALARRFGGVVRRSFRNPPRLAKRSAEQVQVHLEEICRLAASEPLLQTVPEAAVDNALERLSCERRTDSRTRFQGCSRPPAQHHLESREPWRSSSVLERPARALWRRFLSVPTCLDAYAIARSSAGSKFRPGIRYAFT